MPAPSTFNLTVGRGATLDALELVDTRMLVCANSGGGKSHLLRLLIEQTGGRIPVIVLDPEGEFSTVRSKVDVVLVGPDGDVPTSLTSAKILARRLVELRVSAIIDLYDLKATEKRHFVKVFLEALLSLPRSLWGPMLVVVDEAHKFAPESGRDAESRDAVISLMDQGRKRGLGGILATQRLSKLAKDAAGEANNLMIGRFAQDVDLRRASDQLGFSGKSEWATMRDFDAGEFFAVGPAFAHRGVKKIRTAKTKSKHPKAGKRHLLKPPAPTSAIKKVLSDLGDLPAQAQQEKDQLADLRRENAELRRASTAGDSKKVADLEARVASLEVAIRKYAGDAEAECTAARGLVEDLFKLIHEATLEALAAGLPEVLKRLEVLTGQINERHVAISRQQWHENLPAHHQRQRGGALATSPIPPPRPLDPPKPRVTTGGRLPTDIGTGVPWKVIVALLSYGKAAPRSRLAILAGTSKRSSTFRNALTKLKNAGYIVKRDGDAFEATPSAYSDLSGHYEPMGTTPAELIPVWRGKLGTGIPGRVFETLVRNTGRSLDRSELAGASGTTPNSSTFRNALTKLNKLGLLDKSGGTFALTPDLR